MRKHELLVPAGNMECLKQAVYNGCDAVYLACKNFGARKFANNFDREEIVEAIRFCHLYGVRIYVTMNTLVRNEEVEDFIAQARFLHQQGVDALIVQDFGMICRLREQFPNLEIHASTQANISSKEVCELYHQLGVKRVVFSRELSIDEIDSIDVPIEKEAFIHGALCISYSGCCLMSSMLGGRSGNRGECAGVCRMPFALYKGQKKVVDSSYLLSTKELNTSSHIQRLLDSSIYSFKIEGRMKSPFYVGFITRFYRSLIDGEKISLEEEEKRLKTIFNREFTVGRMFFENDKDFMNPKSPNHVGLTIGNVKKVTKDKIVIQLYPGYSLHQGDAIRFLSSQEGFVVNYLYDEGGNLISSTDSIGLLDLKVSPQEGEEVSKTQDYLLMKEFSSYPIRKVPISFHVKAHLQKPLWVEISDGVHSISCEGDLVVSSKTAPMSLEGIQKQFCKLGETPFECTSFKAEVDDHIFIAVKSLNELRRRIIEEFVTLRAEDKISFVENPVSFSTQEEDSLDYLHCVVYNREQLEICLKNQVSKIYIVDDSLYQEYSSYENVYYFVPRCCLHLSDVLKDKSVVSDYASYKGKKVIGYYPLNVMNIYTAYYLSKIGLSSICLSPELSPLDCISFVEKYRKVFGSKCFQVMGSGRVENMIIKGNILQIEENNYDYSLKDVKGRMFPVMYDGRLTHVYHCDSLPLWKNKTKNIGFVLDFFGISIEEVEKILSYYQSL